MILLNIIVAIVLTASRHAQSPFAEASALSPQPQMLQASVPIPSEVCKNTDECCKKIYWPWYIETEAWKSRFRKDGGNIIPSVLSSRAKLDKLNPRLIKFACVDTRSSRMLGKINERRVPGTEEIRGFEGFILECSTSEIPRIKGEPRHPGELINSRRWGECQLNGGQSSSGIGAQGLIGPGETRCLDVEGQNEFAAIDLWLQEAGGVNGAETWQPDFADWLGFTEVETAKEYRETNTAFVSMPIDRKVKRTYRACAKLPAGHGNAMLQVMLVRSITSY